MSNKVLLKDSVLSVNECVEGKPLEVLIKAKLQNKEDLDIETKSISYHDKKDGVLPSNDIRTDRFELALEGLNSLEKSRIAKAKMTVVKDEEVVDGSDKNEVKEGGESA